MMDDQQVRAKVLDYTNDMFKQTVKLTLDVGNLNLRIQVFTLIPCLFQVMGRKTRGSLPQWYVAVFDKCLQEAPSMNHEAKCLVQAFDKRQSLADDKFARWARIFGIKEWMPPIQGTLKEVEIQSNMRKGKDG